MKPTIDDVKKNFKYNDVIHHPKDDITCKFSDITQIWDNGTGGWNGFIKGGGIIILYSGITGKFSDTVS
jgi:hypothetical protein